MEKKEFRIGQVVYLVSSSELIGIPIRGYAIVPVTIISQNDKEVYGVKIETFKDPIVTIVGVGDLFFNVQSANEYQINKVSQIVADMKRKDVAVTPYNEISEKDLTLTEEELTRVSANNAQDGVD